MKRSKVLVVDDNSTNRCPARDVADRWSAAAARRRTAGGSEELERAASAGEPYEIAILDMEMPGMDGETLGAKIKEDQRLSETILILLTSMGSAAMHP